MKSFKFTKEGLPIISTFWQDIDSEKLAAISAAILSISKRYIKEYGCGGLKRILIEAGEEKIVLSEEGENGLLSLWEINRDHGVVDLKAKNIFC